MDYEVFLLKIVHLVAGELSGGAARGAYWLHRGLKNIGIESKLLTNSFDTLGDCDVESVADTFKNKIKSKVFSQLDGFPTKAYRRRKNLIFSTGFWGKAFIRSDLLRWADIVHLHWINAGFVNLKYLSQIKKPIVWTMRDMWPMTGGCHYAMKCNQYESGCGKCPQLGSKCTLDLSKIVLSRKKKYLPKSMKIVGISSWLSECARNSNLFRDFDVQTISNNIDCSEFYPVEKHIARDILGVDRNANVVLTGATSAETFYKGFDKFLSSIEFLPKDNIHLVFFGRIDADALKKIKFPFTSLGFLHDTVALRIAYSSADLFVAPSIMDAFGKTIAESMACRTPVVCFDATGPKDIVDHKKNGFRAKPFEPKDLARGIKWILADSDRYEVLSQNARAKVVNEFDIDVIARKYKKLYSKITDR
jgi:glycosyltransferase involved in cell wall biosynthesis